MFGHQTMLPHQLLFCHSKGYTEIPACWPLHVAKLHERLWESFKEAQGQSTSYGSKNEKWQYDRKANIPFHWSQVTWSWLKPMPTGGEGMMKDQWEEEPYEVECQVVQKASLPILMKNQQPGCLWVLHWNSLFLITLTEGTPLCMVVKAKWAWCTTTTLEGTNSEELNWGSTTKCELSIASPASDRWNSSTVGE